MYPIFGQNKALTENLDQVASHKILKNLTNLQYTAIKIFIKSIYSENISIIYFIHKYYMEIFMIREKDGVWVWYLRYKTKTDRSCSEFT